VKIQAHNIGLLLGTACMLLIISSSVPAFPAPQDFRVEPHRIRVTETFHGRTVIISAEVPRGAQAIVEFKGQVHEEDLVRKGRRWGLWMTVGEIKVGDAPSLYLAMSTDSKLLSKQDSETRWGYGALREQAKFSASNQKTGEEDLFEQFLKLKESEGLYGVFPGALKVVATTDQVVTVQGPLKLPGNIMPENCQVSLTVLKNGKVVEQESMAFPVGRRGVAAFLSSLAQQRPILYGLFAVVVAMAIGLLMGFVFKGMGAH
jgi:Putative transmembrane protein (Alph_Pro_TM)